MWSGRMCCSSSKWWMGEMGGGSLCFICWGRGLRVDRRICWETLASSACLLMYSDFFRPLSIIRYIFNLGEPICGTIFVFAVSLVNSCPHHYISMYGCSPSTFILSLTSLFRASHICTAHGAYATALCDIRSLVIINIRLECKSVCTER